MLVAVGAGADGGVRGRKGFGLRVSGLGRLGVRGEWTRAARVHARMALMKALGFRV